MSCRNGCIALRPRLPKAGFLSPLIAVCDPGQPEATRCGSPFVTALCAPSNSPLGWLKPKVLEGAEVSGRQVPAFAMLVLHRWVGDSWELWLLAPCSRCHHVPCLWAERCPRPGGRATSPAALAWKTLLLEGLGRASWGKLCPRTEDSA